MVIVFLEVLSVLEALLGGALTDYGACSASTPHVGKLCEGTANS